MYTYLLYTRETLVGTSCAICMQACCVCIGICYRIRNGARPSNVITVHDEYPEVARFLREIDRRYLPKAGRGFRRMPKVL